ncbi:hypothetical protein BDD12DRAFT_873410 [Trichophaea hybrida]|nr:hypothetical protein BDD12DRAFT_873410 [Trichophaea hybrida]
MCYLVVTASIPSPVLGYRFLTNCCISAGGLMDRLGINNAQIVIEEIALDVEVFRSNLGPEDSQRFSQPQQAAAIQVQQNFTPTIEILPAKFPPPTKTRTRTAKSHGKSNARGMTQREIVEKNERVQKRKQNVMNGSEIGGRPKPVRRAPAPTGKGSGATRVQGRKTAVPQQAKLKSMAQVQYLPSEKDIDKEEIFDCIVVQQHM